MELNRKIVIKSYSIRRKEYIISGNIRKLRISLQHDGNVDSFVSEDGSTALRFASSLSSEQNGIAASEVLLEYGANPNMPNRRGRSSVHKAASLGHQQLLTLLLHNGGDPLLPDLRGTLPSDLAHRNGHSDVVAFLHSLLASHDYLTPSCSDQQPNTKRSSGDGQYSLFPNPALSSADTASDDSFYSCTSQLQNVTSEASSVGSFVSVAEFLYEDTEQGVRLIEQCYARASSNCSLPHICPPSPRKVAFSQREEAAEHDSGQSVGGEHHHTMTSSVRALSPEELRSQLKDLGVSSPAPALPSTLTTLQKQLIRLRNRPATHHLYPTPSKPTYPRELEFVLRQPKDEAWALLEREMAAPFAHPDPNRIWRGGTNKTCFNYLLLDPRLSCDLPLRASSMEESAAIRSFVEAVFYIGKGSQSRPYHHLYQALDSHMDRQLGGKERRVREIWGCGAGVVSLHIFHNTIPVESYSREAAMIAAIGLPQLTNQSQGSFYGPASTWNKNTRRKLGAHLLCRAFWILLQEGERQIWPADITVPAYWGSGWQGSRKRTTGIGRSIAKR